MGHSAVVHKKNMFVIGGTNENETLSSVEVYSSETNQFSFVSPMLNRRELFGCCLIHSTIMVVGGIIDLENNITDKVEVYDIEKDEWLWMSGSNLPLNLAGFSCDVLN